MWAFFISKNYLLISSCALHEILSFIEVDLLPKRRVLYKKAISKFLYKKILNGKDKIFFMISCQ